MLTSAKRDEYLEMYRALKLSIILGKTEDAKTQLPQCQADLSEEEQLALLRLAAGLGNLEIVNELLDVCEKDFTDTGIATAINDAKINNHHGFEEVLQAYTPPSSKRAMKLR